MAIAVFMFVGLWVSINKSKQKLMRVSFKFDAEIDAQIQPTSQQIRQTSIQNQLKSMKHRSKIAKCDLERVRRQVAPWSAAGCATR